jgi:hypothetical protein
MGVAAGMGGTTTFNTFRSFEVVCPVRGDHRFNLIVNMRSLSHIVKQLFIKIVIRHALFHVRSTDFIVHPAAKRVRVARVALKNDGCAAPPEILRVAAG